MSKANSPEFHWNGAISKRHQDMMDGKQVGPYRDPVPVTPERRKRAELRSVLQDRQLERELLGGDPY